ncbi:hypothetical protein EJ02DRAFT_459390 [Clathrospora elynae]|uniref:Uncharacterized protein n=1 Tax=Clathrospora elynae TaxID=706981 RepID=A0A6A5S9M1_9PLEO|nr:hypothetical protein EJ02DRAFT_459390 [Clathrospora elynae]
MSLYKFRISNILDAVFLDPLSCDISTVTIAHANIVLADLSPAMPSGRATFTKSRPIPFMFHS